jgi:hypothetical protein
MAAHVNASQGRIHGIRAAGRRRASPLSRDDARLSPRPPAARQGRGVRGLRPARSMRHGVRSAQRSSVSSELGRVLQTRTRPSGGGSRGSVYGTLITSTSLRRSFAARGSYVQRRMGPRPHRSSWCCLDRRRGGPTDLAPCGGPKADWRLPAVVRCRQAATGRSPVEGLVYEVPQRYLLVGAL